MNLDVVPADLLRADTILREANLSGRPRSNAVSRLAEAIDIVEAGELIPVRMERYSRFIARSPLKRYPSD